MRSIVFSLLLLANTAVAGTEVGNGGSVVVCPSGFPKKIELLDHYEGRELRKIRIDLGPPDLSVEEKIELSLSRIENLNPHRAKLYRKWVKEFWVETDFNEGDLIPLPDAGPGVLPKDCHLEQIAVQQIPTLPGDRRYIVKKSLWLQLDNDGRAGLVLHEVVLRELVQQKVSVQTTSKFARYFAAFMAGEEIPKMSLRSYIALLDLVGFESADAQQGTEIGLYKCSIYLRGDTYRGTHCKKFLPEFWNDHVVKSATIPLYAREVGAELFWQNRFILVNYRESDPTKGAINFDSKGRVVNSRFFVLESNPDFRVENAPLIFEFHPSKAASSIGVDEQSRFNYAEFGGLVVRVLFKGKVYKCKDEEYIVVDWEGRSFGCGNKIPVYW